MLLPPMARGSICRKNGFIGYCPYQSFAHDHNSRTRGSQERLSRSMKLSQEQNEALAELYHETYYTLSSYAKCSLQDKYLVEEAIQQTFLIACTKPDQVLNSPNPIGWLVITLRHSIQAILQRERKKSMEPYQAEQSIPADFSLDPRLLFESYLTRDEFDLLLRVGVEGYTLAEAAEELGLSAEACKKRVQRAKKKFQKKYSRDF